MFKEEGCVVCVCEPEGVEFLEIGDGLCIR
jgi:hypothetical protein